MPYRPETSRLKHSLVSVLLVVVASVASLAVRPLFDGKSPLLFFVLAVLFAAGYGGTIQGLLATALSAGVALFFFDRNILIVVLAQYTLILFAVLGVAISLILGRFRLVNEALSKAKDDLQLANRKLEEHAGALARSNAELERFAYVVAHDLSAPLRTISTRAKLCLERSSDAIDRESKESLALVLNSARNMGRLISSLLTLARVGHGSAEVQTRIDTEGVAKRCLEALRDEIESTRAVVEIEPLPAVRGNEEQLVRLFQNLVENGLKYRSEKPPIVSISAALEDGEWRFTVGDNGIGIDSKHHAKIFEPFQRLHSRNEYEGEGVGLSICSRIVAQHGGRIWVESSPGSGSRFRFTLPVIADYQLRETAKPHDATGMSRRTWA